MSNDHEPSGAEWELVATEWETNRVRMFEAFRPVSDWLIDAVHPADGETILELAAGPGETGFLAAERVGPSGRVLSTDLAPTMVDAARRGAEARGLTNVECRLMDAQSIEMPSDSVDAVISRLGLMLVPDPRAVFAEVRRVLRAGGRLAYAVMGPPDRNQWMSLMMGALARAGRLPAGDNPFVLGGIFGLATSAVNEQLLTEAGFSDIRCDAVAGAMTVHDADDLWELQAKVAGPVRVALESMSEDEIAVARDALQEMLAPFASGDGYELPSEVAVAAATAP
jgi:ubiquinone/menaquinone biosynthesis C-methylase UbiE